MHLLPEEIGERPVCPQVSSQSIVGIGFLNSNGQIQRLFNGLFGPTDTAAETIPNRTPLTTFFNPGLFQRDYDGANTDEMATIFHEGLHGFTGKTDSELQLALGCQQQVGSINITDYLLQFLVVPPRTPIQACQ